jgi:peptidoglycan/LPS O-acetylase OafA/YrhL
MYLYDRKGALDRRLLRLLAGAAAALVPLAWLGSLYPEPALLQANMFRLLGALVAAAIAWVSSGRGDGRSREGLPWQRCLAAGVVGSLAVTGLSVLVPALGGFSFAGWLTSGIAGGVIVVLAGYALRGGGRSGS